MSLPKQRRAVVLTVAGAFFLLLLDSTILNTSLPRIARDMGVQPLALSPSITGYLLASVCAMPLSAWLASRFGARRIYLLSIGMFTLSSVACGVSAELWQLVLARIVQGAAGGLMLTVGRALAIRDAEKSELLAITSLLVWPALLAPVVGPPLGGWITTAFSWRWNFLLNLPLGLIGMALILHFVPADERREPLPIDWKGVVLSVSGLALFFGGLESVALATERGEAWGTPIVLTVLGAVVLVLCVRHLRSAPRPLLSLAPLSQRTFALSTFAAGTWATMSLHSTPYLLPLLFQLSFGASAAAAGAMLLPYFLGNLAMKTVTTPILRRFGFKQVLLTDGVLSALLIALCGTLGMQTPWVVMAGLLFVAGASRSMLLTAVNTLCFADIEQPQRAAAATLSSVSMLLAQSLGIVASTLMLTGSKAAQARPMPQTEDFRLAFLGIALIGLAGSLQFLRLSRRDGEEVSGANRAAQR